jgi:hypothetical protein
MQSSQSQPGQFAAAIKKSDPRSKAAELPAGIVHGHEDEAPEPAVWPAHLLGPLTGKDASGGETADRPS